jgi:predicted phosphodiesterase
MLIVYECLNNYEGDSLRIALIADIHSNHIAFEAVLNDLKEQRIDEIFFLGDYAFGGSGSVETVDILMNYNDYPFIAIQGNKEGYIEPIEKNEDWIFTEMHYIYNELGKKRIDFLKGLPKEIVVNREGIIIRICHNPSALKMFEVVDRLNREKNPPDISSLTTISNSMNEDICVYGHYHLYMNNIVNKKRFICGSSVGMPFNNDPRAQYVIIEILKDNCSVNLCYVEYDYLKLIEDFNNKHYFENFNIWSLNTAISMLTARNYIGTQHKI